MELREKQVREAVKRMKKLSIMDNTIKEFIEEGKLNKSEYCGILYWLEADELLKVKEFEKEYNACVYHVIKGTYKMCDGSKIEMCDYLYVSADEDEWERDFEDIENGVAFVNTVSDLCPYGEFGTIFVRPSFGGVMRVA